MSTILDAVRAGRLDTIEELLTKGTQVDSPNDYNQTPLHIAIETGEEEITRLLIDKGANINAIDRWGRTPLHIAVK